MLNAILWDNDGVLVDTEGLYFQACREALEPLGVRLSEARFIEFFLKASDGLNRIGAEHGIDEQALESARAWRNTRYTELLRAGVPVIDGAPRSAVPTPRYGAHGYRHQFAAGAL